VIEKLLGLKSFVFSHHGQVKRPVLPWQQKMRLHSQYAQIGFEQCGQAETSIASGLAVVPTFVPISMSSNGMISIDRYPLPSGGLHSELVQMEASNARACAARFAASTEIPEAASVID